VQVLWGHLPGGWQGEPGVVQQEDEEEERRCRDCYDDRKREIKLTRTVQINV
jgi:hypothetical protein